MPEKVNQGAEGNSKTDSDRQLHRQHFKEQLVEAQTGLKETNNVLATQWDRNVALNRELENLHHKQQTIRQEILDMRADTTQLMANRAEYHRRIQEYTTKLTGLNDDHRSSQRIQL